MDLRYIALLSSKIRNFIITVYTHYNATLYKRVLSSQCVCFISKPTFEGDPSNHRQRYMTYYTVYTPLSVIQSSQKSKIPHRWEAKLLFSVPRRLVKLFNAFIYNLRRLSSRFIDFTPRWTVSLRFELPRVCVIGWIITKFYSIPQSWCKNYCPMSL